MEDFTDDTLPSHLYIDFTCTQIKAPVTRFNSYSTIFNVKTENLLKMSVYYQTYYRTRRNWSTRCGYCKESHTETTLCLPPYFDLDAVRYLLHCIHTNKHYSKLPSRVDAIQVVRIAGFLLIKESWLCSFLPRYSPYPTQAHTPTQHCAYMFELYRNHYPFILRRASGLTDRYLLKENNTFKRFYRTRQAHLYRSALERRRYRRLIMGNVVRTCGIIPIPYFVSPTKKHDTRSSDIETNE